MTQVTDIYEKPAVFSVSWKILPPRLGIAAAAKGLEAQRQAGRKAPPPVVGVKFRPAEIIVVQLILLMRLVQQITTAQTEREIPPSHGEITTIDEVQLDPRRRSRTHFFRSLL